MKTSEARMGFGHTNKIDLVSTSSNGVTLIVVHVEDLACDQLTAQRIQQKVNSYLSFAFDGQMHRMYPETRGMAITIHMDIYGGIDLGVQNLFRQLHSELKKHGVRLVVQQKPAVGTDGDVPESTG